VGVNHQVVSLCKTTVELQFAIFHCVGIYKLGRKIKVLELRGSKYSPNI